MRKPFPEWSVIYNAGTVFQTVRSDFGFNINPSIRLDIEFNIAPPLHPGAEATKVCSAIGSCNGQLGELTLQFIEEAE
jgi:hypothetical protein